MGTLCLLSLFFEGVHHTCYTHYAYYAYYTHYA